MELVYSGETIPAQAVTKPMQQAAELALAREGVSNEHVEVSVTFVDREEIRELNRTYRQVDKSTDVLSFPQFAYPEEIPSQGQVSMGDVVICTEQAILQAEDFGHSVERELVYLFTHSIFHLLGYDHMEEEEKQEMRQAEEEIMKMIGLER
ncbi:MAG: rRNA maturation RNase YbeY [Anaerovoracaceae bacterium]